MARTYTKLFTSIVNDSDFIACSLQAKFLYTMIIAMPKLTPAGCVEYRPAKWARLDKTFTAETVEAIVDELVANRFLLIDRDEEEVWVRAWIERDGGTVNPNLAKSVQASIRCIDSRRIRQAAQAVFNAAPKSKAEKDQRAESDRGRGEDPDPDPPEPNSNLQRHTSNGSGPSRPEPVDDFDAAIAAAVDVRRSRTDVLDESKWEPATREALTRQYGKTIRGWLDAGKSPKNAALLALGEEPEPEPAVEQHDPACPLCAGTLWLEPEDDGTLKPALVRCPGVRALSEVS